MANQDYARANHVCHVLHGVSKLHLTLEASLRRLLLETFSVKADQAAVSDIAALVVALVELEEWRPRAWEALAARVLNVEASGVGCEDAATVLWGLAKLEAAGGVRKSRRLDA